MLIPVFIEFLNFDGYLFDLGYVWALQLTVIVNLFSLKLVLFYTLEF